MDYTIEMTKKEYAKEWCIRSGYVSKEDTEAFKLYLKDMNHTKLLLLLNKACNEYVNLQINEYKNSSKWWRSNLIATHKAVLLMFPEDCRSYHELNAIVTGCLEYSN